MADAVQRADQVIRGLLDFSRSEKLDLAPSALDKVIDDSLLLVRHELTRNHIVVQRDRGHDLPSLDLDANKIKQVFINLFMNAVHAMPGGGILSVHTSHKILTAEDLPADHHLGNQFLRGDRVILVRITDSGTGIPEDKIDKLFDPFFTTKPVGSGTGLGLSVTRKILELHRAAITIGNRPDGNGAMVCICFGL
jgi:signal transduction histidine kinase